MGRKRASNYRKPLTQKFYTPPFPSMPFYYYSPAKVLFFLGRNTRYLGEAPLNGLGQTAPSLLPYLAWGFGGEMFALGGGRGNEEEALVNGRRRRRSPFLPSFLPPSIARGKKTP